MRRSLVTLAAGALVVVACGGPSSTGSTGSAFSVAHQATALGEQHKGNYNLGPVAFKDSFWNSCAPYTSDVETATGDLLAGLGLRFNGDGSLCDTCVQLKTPSGKSVIAHVVTTGETEGPNDVDLSQKAYDQLFTGEYPRPMTWALVECPSASDKIRYQFQTEANADWTSLWVRGARLPLRTVEVKSQNHATWTALTRGTDGTLTDEAGFGDGKFQLRLTSYDGQVVTDTFDGFKAGQVLTSPSQFE